MGFNLTDQLPKGDSQLIAVKGNIDNKNVMHHIVLYGCNDVDGKCKCYAHFKELPHEQNLSHFIFIIDTVFNGTLMKPISLML